MSMKLKGSAVETEKCGTGLGAGWECVYGPGSSVGGLVSEIAAEIPEVAAEVGPFCRCGCVVHLGRARPKRLLATSAQSCPGRTFWLIQAEDDCIVEFRVDQFRLPCGTQWLKVRDGPAISSTLVAALPEDDHAAVNSSGPHLLLEFYAETEDPAETQA
ncbi:unnamed protein product [Acanthoscelides obtectus]|uniref:Uncharacterized protein n=1 Tax=Acanthoscelides obtectus TaxID=200917 RepID=A0A9P0L045_ACAOB|nr:unnamed protein product [Acanthoscelides obtectus]CAK1668736.1 hypothetical protein AOBTE_LOCUS26572 [Acanthoscelides obtectus]